MFSETSHEFKRSSNPCERASFNFCADNLPRLYKKEFRERERERERERCLCHPQRSWVSLTSLSLVSSSPPCSSFIIIIIIIIIIFYVSCVCVLLFFSISFLIWVLSIHLFIHCVALLLFRTNIGYNLHLPICKLFCGKYSLTNS